jgi:ADP-dependent NAD(P)H-hydrate dehydratase
VNRRVIPVDDELLAAWPLPAPDAEGDKEDRGRVLVIAGSREVPGAAVLAAIAALRAGAGKLVVATTEPAWATVAAALPEARVISLPETREGGPDASALDLLDTCIERAAGILIGPGMMDARATASLTAALLAHNPSATVVIDALAMDLVRDRAPDHGRVVLTPHAGEMAHLTGLGKEELASDPVDAAVHYAALWRAVVALKGARTCIAMPASSVWVHEAATPGLGTSGSGDVLAGVMVGLAARGAPPEQAAVWGVALHARAGARLASRGGGLGFLARELAAEIPALMETSDKS